MKKENNHKNIVKMNLEGLDFDYTVFLHIKRGLNPSQIARKYKMSKQRIDYYIRHLKHNGYIKKIGKGVWETLKNYSQNEPRDTPLNLRNFLTISKKKSEFFKPDSVRGHAFNFVLKLPKIKNWDRRKVFLKRNKINFKKVGFGGTGQSFEFKNFKVWLCNNSIIVYFPKWKEYFYESADTSRNYAIYDFKEVIKALERFLSCNFKISGKYVFRVSKQHYSLIKNSLAMQYNRKNEKLEVRDEGGLWLWIDDSDNLKEIETGHKETAVSDNKIIQDLFNSVKKNPFTADDIKEIKNNQKEFFELIKTNSKNMIYISTVIEQMSNITKKIIKNGGN